MISIRTQRYWKRIKRAGIKFINRHMTNLVFIGILILGILIGLFIGIKVTEHSQATKLNDYGRELVYKSYIIQSGDTLWNIASDLAPLNPEYNDIRQYVQAIKDVNTLHDDNVKAGQVIIIPYYINTDSNYMNKIYNKYGIDSEQKK